MNGAMNHHRHRPGQLDGVIQSKQLGFKMQSKVTDLLDISAEPQPLKNPYGVTDKPNAGFARQCLMAPG